MREFDRLVGEALDGLPTWVRHRLDNVEVVIEEAPPAEAPDLLGLYEGIPITERGMDYTWTLPDRITLYRSTIESETDDEQELKQVIAETVIHEVAHFFGISDERLRELGRD